MEDTEIYMEEGRVYKYKYVGRYWDKIMKIKTELGQIGIPALFSFP
jgi:hypothetical protein